MTIRVRGAEEVRCVMRVYFRKRKPPKVEPRWFMNLNPEIRARERLGMGADLGSLVDPAKLEHTLQAARKLAEEAKPGAHLLSTTLVVLNEGEWKLLARWDHWSQKWACDSVVVTDAEEAPPRQ